MRRATEVLSSERILPDTNMGVALSSVDAVEVAPTKAEKASDLRRFPTWWWIGVIVIVAVLIWSFFAGFLPMMENPAEIHQPGVGDFFPEAMIWEGTVFEVNRLVIARILAAVVVCAVVGIVALRVTKVPTRGQAAIEVVAEYVRRNIGIELMGNKRGRRYAITLAVIFFGVFAMNLTGIIPGINIAASSVMSVPLVFAVFAYVAFVAAGIRERGGMRFFKEQLMPAGVPKLMYLLLTPIELFSTFVVRPCSLAIRLLANMIAGHILLATCYFGTQSLLVATGGLKIISVATFAGAIAVTAFELFVALLQAYVFTLLTAVYIKMSVEAH